MVGASPRDVLSGGFSFAIWAVQYDLVSVAFASQGFSASLASFHGARQRAGGKGSGAPLGFSQEIVLDHILCCKPSANTVCKCFRWFWGNKPAQIRAKFDF